MAIRRIGIMGGSGLYELPGFEILEEFDIDTPFGKPSDKFFRVKIEDTEVIFLSRHGRGHVYPAPFVNFRANIYGMKEIGVDTLISVNAVGSMKEEYHPAEIVIPDQFIDITKGRKSTFFDDIAVHVELAEPVCPVLRKTLYSAGKTTGARIHNGGISLCIDGPAFSTRAESNLYRTWGVDVIGMTSATEAKLAREAEVCYASLSIVTDYDVWKEAEDEVSVEVILQNMQVGVEKAKEIIFAAIPRVEEAEETCTCREALSNAIVTDPSLIPIETQRKLSLLIGKYMPPEVD